MISLIAALEKKNLVIGKNGKLPWHVPADLKHYKKITQNNITIMGRKTFSSINPDIFIGRHNIVISKTIRSAKNSTVYSSLDQALKELSFFFGDSKEIIICGGANIYKQSLPYIDRMYLTFITGNKITGDTYFPSIDYKLWTYISSSSPRMTKEGITYTFNILERKNK